MNSVRRNRLIIVCFLFLGAVLTITATIFALQENLEFFYLPDQIVNGEAPRDERIRAGGMVLEGSLKFAEEGLSVAFQISDLKGSAFPVHYEGLLPGLFKEGQGTVVTGSLAADGVFMADSVLAKHDEKYIPPELESLHLE